MLDEFDAHLLGWPGVDKRRMFGADCYLARGRMFAFRAEMGLVVKVPPADRERLLERPDAAPFLMRPGVAFGEWVQWRPGPDEGDLVVAMLRSAFDYVSGLRSARPRRKRRR